MAPAYRATTVGLVGSRAYDLLWGTTLRATTRAHRILDRMSGGRLMRHFPGGAPVVWITTTGRRSGEPRRTPLLAVRDGDAWIIAGSNAGQERVPDWVHNVRADPRGTVDTGADPTAVEFVEVPEPDRSRLYSMLARQWSAYDMYQRNAGRTIPVFRLRPVLDTD